jgi:cbb3-type cytochrome oxidase subunit 1
LAKLPLHFRFFRAAVIYLLVGGFLGVLFSFETFHNYTHGTTAVSAHIVLMFLGWVTMTIIGAMSKMVPTMIGRDLYSEDWGDITYWFMNIGIIGYSAMLIFEGLDLQLYWISLPLFYANINFLFVSFIVVGSIIFAYNLYKTIGFQNRKSVDLSIGLSSNFYRVSTAYFVLSIVISILAILGLTADVFSPLRFADVLWIAPFTTLGWITMTIMGAMYNLLPMFTNSKIPNLQLAKFQFWTMNIGIAFTGVAGLLGAKRMISEGVAVSPLSVLQTVGVAFAGVGAFLFVYIMALTIVTRKRKELNISVKFYIVALFYFSSTTLFGVWLKTQPGYMFSEGTTIILGHNLLSTIGFVTLTIMGSMYSILPMWSVAELHARSKKEPSVLTEMYNERLAHLSFWLSSIGVAGYIAGLMGEGYVMASSGFTATENAVLPYRVLSAAFVIVLAVGVFLFANNIWKILNWLKD